MATQLPPPGAPDTLYVVDLSSYVLRAYHAIAPLSSPAGEPTHAVFGTLTMLERLIRDHRPAMIAIAMDSGRDTFRRELYSDYKANRPPAPEDLKIQFARCEQLVQAWGLASFRQTGMEADDIIACLVDRARAIQLRVVIIAADKDLMQLVGDDVVLFDTMRQRVFGPEEVSDRFGVRVDQLRDYLALVGDTSDNVPGIPSVGPKTAAQLLRSFDSFDGIFANLDKISRKKLAETLKINEPTARLCQQLVTLRRDCNIEFDEQRLRSQERDWTTVEELYIELGFQKQLTSLRQMKSDALHGIAEDKPVENRPELPISTTVATAASFSALLVELREAECVAVAPVLSKREYPQASLAALGFAVSPDRCFSVQFPFPGSSEPESAATLQTLLDEIAEKLVVHDLKQLAMALQAIGAHADPRTFDILLASYLINPESPNLLEQLASEHLGLELPADARLATPDAKGACCFEVRLAMAGLRAVSCHRLHKLFAERLESTGMSALARAVEAPLAIELGHMQRRGVLVDTAQLNALSTQCAAEIVRLEADAHRLAGKPFNVNSPRQLESILFDEAGLKPLKRTKTARSTDAATLEALADAHPLPRVILELRQIAKLKGTYIDALPNLRDPTTGRIHTTWEQAVTATGRLSSNDPNMQNIPIRSELGRAIRSTFVAPPDHQLVSADYSQIELRVLAHLSEDPVLVEAFATGQDVHTRTAAEIFEVAPDQVSTEQRRRAKAVNFGVIYGQGESGLAKSLGIPRADAARFIATYFKRHVGVQSFMERTVEEARSGKTLRSILGRRRMLPDIGSGNRARRLAAERIAMNMPIQASAADILKLAMLELREPVTPGARMVLTVHDELVFEVPDGEVPEAKRRITEAMTSVYALKVPLLVSVGHGPNWNAAH